MTEQTPTTWPPIQPSADPTATAYAIAYALYTRLPEEEQGKGKREPAQAIGEMADIILKRGAVSIRRS